MAKNESQGAGDLGKQQSQVGSSDSAGKVPAPTEEYRRGETATRHRSGPTELPLQFGRYRVKRKLGGGGMGTVYLVENTELEREEALKVPHFAEGDDPQLRVRFLREAKSAAKLDHSNLCPVYDAGVQDGIYYITMRFLKGKLLSDYTATPQPARKSVEIVAKLAQALESAHGKGVIHRDLKPSNVMMVGGVGPVVMDFGLAKQVLQPDQTLTQVGSMLGTPAYMPPEQVNGQLDQMGPASDVYSLGVILYELLTGQLPFQGTTAAVLGQIHYAEPPLPSSLIPGLNPTLDEICWKAMAKVPLDRYPAMKAFVAVLMDFLRSTPATTGAGKRLPVTGDKDDMCQAATVVPGPQPADDIDGFFASTLLRLPRDDISSTRRKNNETLIGHSDGARKTTPKAKATGDEGNSQGYLRIGLAVGAASFCFLVFVYWVQLGSVTPELPKVDQLQRVTRANFDKLAVGMPLFKVVELLGTNNALAGLSEMKEAFGSGSDELAVKAQWVTAVQLKIPVHRWTDDNQTILICGDTTTMLCYAQTIGGLRKCMHKGSLPAEMVSRENFEKLIVGMSRAQVEEILGIGISPATTELSSYLPKVQSAKKDAWFKAWNEGNVLGHRSVGGSTILVGYSLPVQDATTPLPQDAKAQAFIYTWTGPDPGDHLIAETGKLSLSTVSLSTDLNSGNVTAPDADGSTPAPPDQDPLSGEDENVKREVLAADISANEGSRAGEVRDDNSLKLKLCWCPAGTLPGFWIGKYEVTQSEWAGLVGSMPSRDLNKGKGDRHPIYNVSLEEAAKFCLKLTETERNAGRLPLGSEYRLPTEAQWEYACRAGTTTASAFGDKLSSKQANFNGDWAHNGAPKGPSHMKSVKVGSYRPNAWGVYDMHGNVKEFTTTPGRVRGGSWHDSGRNCCSEIFIPDPPSASESVGFRVVRVLSEELKDTNQKRLQRHE